MDNEASLESIWWRPEFKRIFEPKRHKTVLCFRLKFQVFCAYNGIVYHVFFISKREKNIELRYFNVKRMLLKPSFNGPFGLSGILHSSASFAAGENIYNILWFSV